MAKIKPKLQSADATDLFITSTVVNLELRETIKRHDAFTKSDVYFVGILATKVVINFFKP